MSGDAIHTRTIVVEVGPERAGRRTARGRVVDRRHRGLTHVGSSEVGPGPVHDMSAELELDCAAGRVARAGGAMARAAFDGSAMTRFESCRDILPHVADLAGAPLDGGLARAVRDALGHERGCYHLTTMVLAMAPVLERVGRAPPEPQVGVRRTLRFEARELERAAVGFETRLRDTDGAGGAREARLAFRVEPQEMLLRDVEARAAPDETRHPEAEARLAALPLFGGFARRAIEALSDCAGAEELLELALGCNAITTQAMILAPMPRHAPARLGREHLLDVAQRRTAGRASSRPGPGSGLS